MANIYDEVSVISEARIRLNFLANKEKMPGVVYQVFENNQYTQLNVPSKFFKDLTLQDKVIMAKARIKEFIESLPNQEIMISFSGGKDSCVLKYLVDEVQKEMGISEYFPTITAMEIFHPETFKFIKDMSRERERDVILPWIKSFDKLIKQDGIPMISKQLAQKISHIRNTQNHKTYIRATLGLDNKIFGVLPIKYIHFLDKELCDYKISHKCCDFIKGPVKHDKRPVFIGTTIQESRLRRNTWLKYGCIGYEKGKPATCKPLSLWTEKDIWNFIVEKNIEVSPVYKLDRESRLPKGYLRSGCVCCMFGLSLEEMIKEKTGIPNRFELLFASNRKAFDYYVLGEPQLWKPLTHLGIHLDIECEEYEKLYRIEKNNLEKWYSNKRENVRKILDEIELRNPSIWNNQDEKEEVLRHYGG